MNNEGFRPVSHEPPVGWFNTVKFYLRVAVDFQVFTVVRDLKPVLKSFQGKVLDVGCGQSPYRYLLDDKKTSYVGIDIADAINKFDYQNSEIVHFNGREIPFGNSEFDALMSTEVLEHVEDYPRLISEMHRVLKAGGTGILTVPWSARFHYIPYDYFRFTPSALKNMFAQFSNVQIKPRGSDVVTIVSKLVVIFARNLTAFTSWRVIFIPVWLCLMPLLLLAVCIAHLALLLGLGSAEDPLGYTIVVNKTATSSV